MILIASAAAAAEPELAPLVLDHFARTDSDADARFLLDAPAGKHGFVESREGHLVTADGRRIRFWGVNVAGFTPGSALLPPHSDAEVFAAELARLGVNAVRFQFLDLPKQQRSNAGVPATNSPGGLIDGTKDDTRSFDPGQLDRLDYLCAQLKARGVYLDFNLNVGRRYRAGDGVVDYDLIGVGKGITYLDPRLIELQREYARMLLTHRNPYTQLAYAHDPAVAIVEIVNENSLLEFWQRNWFRGELAHGAPNLQLDLTAHGKAILLAHYAAWLAAHRSPEQIGRLRTLAGVGPSDPIPLLRKPDFAAAPAERFETEAEFLTDEEAAFLGGMRRYLKRDLGVQSLVIGTADHTYWIPGLPLLQTTRTFDIVDAHVYWQHPAISGRRNTPMVNDPLHSIEVKLTRSTMAGQPFTVSEVNEPFPSDYGAELIPILAAYGAFQDWDGIFLYAFEPKLAARWLGQVGDHFDIAQDPVKVAQLPVGGMLFLRPDVRPARRTIERTYTRGQVRESMRLPEAEDPYFTPGFPLAWPLEHGSRIRSLDGPATASWPEEPAPDPIRSDTGELAWHHAADKGGVVAIDTPRTSALVGFIPANGVATSRLAADISNPFAAITLSSLDGKPISSSGLLLLTAGGRVENTGQGWDARRAKTDPWGGPPTRIEPIRGWILLKEIAGAVGVTAVPLDGAFRPQAPIAGRRLEAGWEIAVGAVPATSYLIHISH